MGEEVKKRQAIENKDILCWRTPGKHQLFIACPVFFQDFMIFNPYESDYVAKAKLTD